MATPCLAECRRVHLPPSPGSSRMRTDAPFFLLYDGDCRICTAFARAVTVLPGTRSIRSRPVQESYQLLGGMSEADALASAHVVSPDGSIRSGPDVLPAIVGALLAQPQLVARVESHAWARATADRVYRILVAFRGRLSCAAGATSSVARSPR